MADGPHITAAQGVIALREAAYNTDAGVGTSNGLEVVMDDLSITPTDTYDGSRSTVLHGAGGELKPNVRAGRTFNISLKGELKGIASTFTAGQVHTDWPLYNVLLGCGYSGTVGSGDLTMDLVTPNKAGSFSLGIYSADKLHKYTGIRGSIEISAPAAGIAQWSFTGRGVGVASYPTETTLPSITYAAQAVLPPVFINQAPTLGSWSPIISQYTVGVNNELSERLDGSAADGHSGFVITNRSTSWSFPGETVALSTFDPWSTSLSGTTSALNIQQGNTANSHTFDFDAPVASTNPPSDIFSADNGKLIYDLNGTCHVSSGNDELTIKVS